MSPLSPRHPTDHKKNPTVGWALAHHYDLSGCDDFGWRGGLKPTLRGLGRAADSGGVAGGVVAAGGGAHLTQVHHFNLSDCDGFRWRGGLKPTLRGLCRHKKRLRMPKPTHGQARKVPALTEKAPASTRRTARESRKAAAEALSLLAPSLKSGSRGAFFSAATARKASAHAQCVVKEARKAVGEAL